MEGYVKAMSSLQLIQKDVAVSSGADPLKRRLALRALVDAIVAHRVFEIRRHELEYIMETFPIVKESDIARFGDYRTKMLILDAFDGISGSISPDEVLETLLQMMYQTEHKA